MSTLTMTRRTERQRKKMRLSATRKRARQYARRFLKGTKQEVQSCSVHSLVAEELLLLLFGFEDGGTRRRVPSALSSLRRTADLVQN